MMNRLDEIFHGSKSISQFADQYLKYLSFLLERLDRASIEKMTQTILDARNTGKKIIFIGNGGSAATASHFANDFAIGTKSPHKPFKAISLTDNNAVMTAIGNDFGYDELFTKQLEVLLEPGDVVVAISASGNSPNIVKALEFCKARGNTTIGLSGFDGGKLKEMSDISVHAQTPKGEYGPVEDVHMIMDHLIGSYLIRYVLAEAKKA